MSPVYVQAMYGWVYLPSEFENVTIHLQSMWYLELYGSSALR